MLCINRWLNSLRDPEFFGTPIRGHTVLHTRAGLGISMLQWILFFFSKDTLQDSCVKGQEHKSKNGGGRGALNPMIVEALIGKL